LGVLLESERQSGQQGVSAKDAQHAIELMGEFDGFSGVAAVAGQRGQSDDVRAQSDSVVGVDDTLVVQTEAAVEIEAARQASEIANRIGGGTGEALVVVGAKLLQHNVGLGQGGGAGQAQFADQAILKGAPGALDAAFGLGRVGGDLLDADSSRARPS